MRSSAKAPGPLSAAWRRIPQALRSPLRKVLLRTLTARKLVWREKGVSHELEFWRRWSVRAWEQETEKK